MVFERPSRPGKPQPSATNQPNPAAEPANSGKKKKVIQVGGGNRGNGSNDGSNRDDRNDNGAIPSPWLGHPIDPVPSPNKTASFVEYLRWMRAPNGDYKDTTKVQILQMAEEGANYRDRFTQLTNRTKLIAGEGNTFQVKCPWRIRVGGHRGPESILLPAFDALGMPYIPSSTLRGVARTQAIRALMADGRSWKDAEKDIAPYFGSLEAIGANRTGKVIFLDAYPLPHQSSGGLTVDMANNIWGWEDNQPQYSPNPNPFFSLQEATFLIGIRPTAACDNATFERIQQWLIAGLQAGIGSQVNTGYGGLLRAGAKETVKPLLKVSFCIEGQLIHGRQRLANVQQPFRRDRDGKLKRDKKGNLMPDTFPDAEVRPVAFKSMMRYWFRTFALGVLQPSEVQQWEANLFGSINLQTHSRGWIQVQVNDGVIVRREAKNNRDEFGEQTGTLSIYFSSEAPVNLQDQTKILLSNLAWMMFHLGGIGQGARRPCYSRQNRDYPPWWRGSNLIAESEEDFWELPNTIEEFQQKFQQRLQAFYNALTQLTGRSLNPRSPLTVGQVSRDQWIEAVDSQCRVIVCAGESNYAKSFALATLHAPQFKNGQDYDGNLCGQVRGTVKPSPVWIADLGNYQVVTVFGATQDPRKTYLETLKQDAAECRQIFP